MNFVLQLTNEIYKFCMFNCLVKLFFFSSMSQQIYWIQEGMYIIMYTLLIDKTVM